MTTPFVTIKYIEKTSSIWYNLVVAKTNRKELVDIYRQELFDDIHMFTAQPKAKFYDKLFLHLDVECLDAATAKTGRRGFLKQSLLCAFIVMKCEGFSQITDLAYYLDNNRLIAYYCGFDIIKLLLSYCT